MARIIAIVTGANGGVGYGICHRLLLNLSRDPVQDAAPRPALSKSGIDNVQPRSGDTLTLILACRNRGRALAARMSLLTLLDADLEKRRKSDPKSYDYGVLFRDALQIDFVRLDLASIDGVFEFCNEIQQRFPYISHIVCNAGLGDFTGLDWPGVLKQFFTDSLINTFTYPRYKLQLTGSMSNDGLGWIWQCNLFGHYLMVRNLRPQLEACVSTPARIIWISSAEARAEFFDPEDWQCTKTHTSYEASKYQTEIIAHRLNSYTHDPNAGLAAVPKIRHLVVHPAIVATSIFYQWLGPILNACMIAAFYIARWCGSPYHTITSYKAAISATHVALVDLAYLPDLTVPVRYGSTTNRRGKEGVDVSHIQEYENNIVHADAIIARCDALCEAYDAQRSQTKK